VKDLGVLNGKVIITLKDKTIIVQVDINNKVEK
jgi:hypothetical protein